MAQKPITARIHTAIMPDSAACRRMILGDKVLPNTVPLGRERERR
jgi:hypothetical protein